MFHSGFLCTIQNSLLLLMQQASAGLPVSSGRSYRSTDAFIRFPITFELAMRTIERDIVAAYMYSADGRLFLARHSDPAAGVVYGDVWKVPGGGVEGGESKTAALIREIFEETGIDISSFPHELVDDTRGDSAEKVLRGSGERVIAKMKFFTYRIMLDKNAADIAVTLDPHEFTEYLWALPEDFASLPLSPPTHWRLKEWGLLV